MFLFDLFSKHQLELAYNKAIGRPNPSWLRVESVDKATFYEAIGVGINHLFSSKSGGRRWVEQTPQYGLMAEDVALLFPGACFVHILRDGRDVVNSMMNIYSKYSSEEFEARKKSGYLPAWPTNFRSACEAWRYSVEACMKFAANYPDRCITVRNEQLGAESESEFIKLFCFLYLPYEDGPIQFFQTKRLNSSFPSDRRSDRASSTYTNPWDRWTIDQRYTFLDVAGQTMLRYGISTEEELNPYVGDSYQRLVCNVISTAKSVLPKCAVVLVVNKGDDSLLAIEPRTAWPFPRAADGSYAGYYPADSTEAVAQLESLKEEGAQYLLFPKTAYWWFTQYNDFHGFLQRSYQLFWQSDCCIIYKIHSTVR